jgi:hypothetical protein
MSNLKFTATNIGGFLCIALSENILYLVLLRMSFYSLFSEGCVLFSACYVKEQES